MLPKAKNVLIVIIALVMMAAALALKAAEPMISFVWKMLTSYFQMLLIFGTLCLLVGGGITFYLMRSRTPRQRKLSYRELERRLR